MMTPWLCDWLQNGDPAVSGTRPRAGLSEGVTLWVWMFADGVDGRRSLRQGGLMARLRQAGRKPCVR